MAQEKLKGTIFKEYKTTYYGNTIIFDCVLAKKTSKQLVIIYEIPKPRTFLDCNLPEKSQSYGYFWPSRSYNVYHWIDPDGRTLLFYVNISKDTTILENRVVWKDLIVDVVNFPDGTTRVLDEDEIPSTMSKEDRGIIEATKELLLSNVKKLMGGIEFETRRTRNLLTTSLFSSSTREQHGHSTQGPKNNEEIRGIPLKESECASALSYPARQR